MDIIYLSYDGMTDSLGQSQVIPYLIGLSKKGYSIEIVSCEKQDKFRKQKNVIEKLLTENNIAWHPVVYSTLPSVLSKQLNLFRLKNKVVELLKKNKHQIIHCRSYMAALIGLEIKKTFGIKFIFDMRGFWADERIDGNIWRLSNPIHKILYNYFKKKEIDFLLNADYVISLTENAKNEILSWGKLQGKNIPIQVIPCCVDLDLFSLHSVKLQEQKRLREELKIKSSDFVISYLGSIGTWYMLEEMLDFFKMLCDKKSTAKFLFITNDNGEEIILKAKKKQIEPDKIIIQSASRVNVALYLSLSELSVYFIKQAYSKKASSPTKTGEILAMGIPIVTNSGIGDSDAMLMNSGAGLIINNFTSENYNSIIKQIDVVLKTDKTKIRAVAEHYFSLEKGVEKYNTVYKKLTNE